MKKFNIGDSVKLNKKIKRTAIGFEKGDICTIYQINNNYSKSPVMLRSIYGTYDYCNFNDIKKDGD